MVPMRIFSSVWLPLEERGAGRRDFQAGTVALAAAVLPPRGIEKTDGCFQNAVAAACVARNRAMQQRMCSNDAAMVMDVRITDKNEPRVLPRGATTKM